MNITVKDGQSLLDLQLIAYGSIEGIVQMCAINDMGITDDLEDGQLVKAKDIYASQIVALYGNRGIEPATALVPEIEQTFAGIGYMRIGIDFIVKI